MPQRPGPERGLLRRFEGEVHLQIGRRRRAVVHEAKEEPGAIWRISSRLSAYPERTIADCTRAIEIDPELAVAYLSRGIAYARKGDLRRAATDQQKALSLDPSLRP